MDKSGIKRPGIGGKHSLIKSRTFIAVVIMLLLFCFQELLRLPVVESRDQRGG